MADQVVGNGVVNELFVDQGDGTHARKVANVGAPTSLGIKTAANSMSVAPASDAKFVAIGSVAASVADADAPVKAGGVYNVTQPTYTDGNRTNLQVNSRGELLVALAGGVGTASSHAGVSTTQGTTDASGAAGSGVTAYARGMVLNGSTWDRRSKPNATARLLSAAASTNATSVKASAGNVHKIFCNNVNAADRFLKLYNKASSPTVGTDVPVLTFLLPLSTKNISIDLTATGHYFSTGIAYAITTAAADADTGAVSAGDITCLNITYS